MTKTQPGQHPPRPPPGPRGCDMLPSCQVPAQSSVSISQPYMTFASRFPVKTQCGKNIFSSVKAEDRQPLSQRNKEELAGEAHRFDREQETDSQAPGNPTGTALPVV